MAERKKWDDAVDDIIAGVSEYLESKDESDDEKKRLRESIWETVVDRVRDVEGF